jgi:GMP synthase (glutamine-hydrolysing)
MARTAHVLRHVLHEDMGVFHDVLIADGWAVVYNEVPVDGVDRAGAIAADVLFVLGGPCAAYERAIYPWLAGETAIIAERIAAGGAVLGICLGAQLIAAALGARVYSGAAGAEIGWGPVTLTTVGRSGPLGELDGVPVMNWHGDTFDLPEGATLLASTHAYAHQAFAVGERVLGLQFHPELDGSGIEHWLIGQTGAVDVAAIREGARVHGAGTARAGAAMLRAWLSEIAFLL